MDKWVTGFKRERAEGGNSSRAERLAKGNRYGKETHKQRFPTHVRFCMRLLTYTTKQTISGATGAPQVPATNTAATVGYNLRPEGDVRNYNYLGLRTTTGNGTMSLNACGVWWTWAEELPTPDCPWLHTYFAYKLDAAGFNLCDPLQFSQGCTRYTHVKQGPSCATFVFPDAPIGKAGPVRRQYPLLPSSFLPGGSTPQATPIVGSAIQPATIEERGIGVWEMIIIPPRKMKSIWIEQCVSQSGWDNLIDMGFKPRPAQKVTKIYCSNGGIDCDDLPNLAAIRGITLARQRNAAPNFGSNQNFNISNLKFKKMTYVDTEDVCQYTAVADPGADTVVAQVYPDVAGSNVAGLGLYAQQGYPCVPFGSAVVFRFRQYAPVQTIYNTDLSVAAYNQTCVRQTIPMDLYLDSVTTFKNPVKGAFDLDLAFTSPDLRPT